MRIDGIQYNSSIYSFPIAFRGNSKPDKESRNIFFVDMFPSRRYESWGEKMLEYRDKISKDIRNKKDFNYVIESCKNGVKDSYAKCKEKDGSKFCQDVYEKDEQNPFHLYIGGRGEEYYNAYRAKCEECDFKDWSSKPNDEYKEASVSTFVSDPREKSTITIKEGWSENSKNLSLAQKEYDKLLKKENPTLKEINRSVAIIQWLIAQESPWWRGSDSIANLLTKSIYEAYDVEISPVKSGYGLDFEAWYRDLDDYIEIYPTLFEKEPYKRIYR